MQSQRLPLLFFAAGLILLSGAPAPAENARTDAAANFARPETVPRNLDELWAGFPEFDRATPLEAEVLKEWEQDGIVCRLVRYQVGIFKGAPARVAAFYAFPKGSSRQPALLELHGGGQSASLNSVTAFARHGYAALSLNWGGNRLNLGDAPGGYDGPQTDWGNLDATHPPQRNSRNHFAGALTPDEFTLDAVESPRNSNWFLVLIAARRAITFLEQQPEVDPARIGVFGHSMGGKLTTNLAGIDPRVRAAVPSCGGGGDLNLESQTDLPGCRKTRPTALELACVSDNAYIPASPARCLWLSPANDFHAHIDNMAWNWRNVPDDRVRFSIAPHLNHRHTEEHEITRLLWFEEHLKGAFKHAATPRLALDLHAQHGVPRVDRHPGRVDAGPLRRPLLLDRPARAHPVLARRRGREGLTKAGAPALPGLSPGSPSSSSRTSIYELPAAAARRMETAGSFTLSTRVLSAAPAQLLAAGVKATDAPERMIDDGARGWTDWYRLNWGHPPLWSAATRKLKDPKWRGPDGATLAFEIRCETDNTLVLTFNCNAWGAIRPGRPAVDYTVAKELKGSPDWQNVSVERCPISPRPTRGRGAAPDQTGRASPSSASAPADKWCGAGGREKVDGKPWTGPREIRNLRWVGGEYAAPVPADAAPPVEER
jgi:dienelactone hydrolase